MNKLLKFTVNIS